MPLCSILNAHTLRAFELIVLCASFYIIIKCLVIIRISYLLIRYISLALIPLSHCWYFSEVNEWKWLLYTYDSVDNWRSNRVCNTCMKQYGLRLKKKINWKNTLVVPWIVVLTPNNAEIMLQSIKKAIQFSTATKPKDCIGIEKVWLTINMEFRGNRYKSFGFWPGWIWKIWNSDIVIPFHFSSHPNMVARAK